MSTQEVEWLDYRDFLQTYNQYTISTPIWKVIYSLWQNSYGSISALVMADDMYEAKKIIKTKFANCIIHSVEIPDPTEENMFIFWVGTPK